MRHLKSVLLLAPLVLAACVLNEELKPLETLLDQQSAITVETMGEPYILANEKVSLAANARDYLDMRLLESDRMGKRVYMLSLVAFSTVDRHGRPSPTLEGLAAIELHAGAKTYPLTALAAGAEAHGLSERIFPRRNGYVGSAEYSITPELVRDLAAAPEAEVWVDVGQGDNLHYTPWQAANEGLKVFSERLPRGGR